MCDVGTWTSATPQYADPLLRWVLGDDGFERLSLRAYRDQCDRDPGAEAKARADGV